MRVFLFFLETPKLNLLRYRILILSFLHFALCILVNVTLNGQNFTSYFTGNTNDTITAPLGGICMMGGANEHNEAMRWFLRRSGGGDVLVLRASGSDGYNNYMYTQLGVKVNSVETIVCHNKSGSTDPYILERIRKAEAIWFAGGDQWNYVNYWRGTEVARLINEAVAERNIVIGGTSAGMAILGGFYFSAQNGSVTSQEALSNPYRNDVRVDSSDFLNLPFMDDVITDSHYDDPDRRGRHVAFLARIFTDYGREGRGIACNEYVAVCVDSDGIASVYGDHPKYQEYAYFVQTNCETDRNQPEVCEPGQSLTWNLDGEALKVYEVPGTNNGANTFDLKDWTNGTGGNWQHWFVVDGNFTARAGKKVNCEPINTHRSYYKKEIKAYPSPFTDQIHLQSNAPILNVQVMDIGGRLVHQQRDDTFIDTKEWPAGIYILKVRTAEGRGNVRVVKSR